MIVGCVKEIKPQESRVGLTPANVLEYRRHGHTVLVESAAGAGCGFSDDAYRRAGAQIVDTADAVWERSTMVVKVKEPLESEFKWLREDLILFTYLHLAANLPLTQALLNSGCKGVAYETLSSADGGLPLLRPMSEIAGRLSAVEGAKCLQKPCGGKGVLLSGVPGTPKAKVVILGAGVVGVNACKMALGLGADVTMMDVKLSRLAWVDDLFAGHVKTLYSTHGAIAEQLTAADLVIGAVLVPGARAPKLIQRNMLQQMQRGSVIVDVAVDQGGCTEATVPTTHADPTFTVDGVVMYCVANMPGAVANTSTWALTNATLPYGLKIADLGLEGAADADAGIKDAINTYRGRCVCAGVCDAFGLPFTPIDLMINQ